jgi:hypothetical protein
MEDTRLVHAALGHQKMEVHVKIDPVPEDLDGGDDPGRKRAPGHNLEVTAQGPEGAAAEIAEETIRMRLYEEHAAPGKIKAFVTIGGSWANMGTDSSVLKLEPGLAKIKEIPLPLSLKFIGYLTLVQFSGTRIPVPGHMAKIIIGDVRSKPGDRVACTIS